MILFSLSLSAWPSHRIVVKFCFTLRKRTNLSPNDPVTSSQSSPGPTYREPWTHSAHSNPSFWTFTVALWPGRCCRALSCNLFSFYQHYFWFSRSLQSLFWHKLVRFNQLQTHSADRTLRLRYYDGLTIPAYVSSALANIGSYSAPLWRPCCKCIW